MLLCCCSLDRPRPSLTLLYFVDAVYSTTPRYRIMETGSTLRSTENKALIFVEGASFYRPSPHARNPVHKAPHYLGYVASLGSNITILCNAKDGLLPGSSELRFQAWEAVSKRQTYLLRSLAKSDDRLVMQESCHIMKSLILKIKEVVDL